MEAGIRRGQVRKLSLDSYAAARRTKTDAPRLADSAVVFRHQDVRLVRFLFDLR